MIVCLPAQGENDASYQSKQRLPVRGVATSRIRKPVPAGSTVRVIRQKGFVPTVRVERKLMFGARPGVTLTVVTWFLAHMEHNLGLPPAQ